MVSPDFAISLNDLVTKLVKALGKKAVKEYLPS
jgi:hypothetical protein